SASTTHEGQHMKHRLMWAAFAFAACLGTTHTVQADTSADTRFRTLYEKEWSWRKAQFQGVSDEDSVEIGQHLPDVSASAQKTRMAYWDNVLQELNAIAPPSLSAENRINAQIYQAQIQNLADDIRFGLYEMPFNSDSSFWSNLGFMAR